MLDPQNIINISGGFVSDPEIINDGRIFKATVAVDYSGSDKGSDNNTGYFDVVYYLKDKDGYASKNASFVAGQVDSAKMKKGTSVAIVGRLVQERWKQDDKTRSRVVIVAEHLAYASRGYSSKSSDSASGTAAVSQAAIPSSF